MKRRDFLKGSMGILGGTVLGSTFGGSLLAATTPKQKKLVVIHLSGANDGINMLVPYSDPFYSQIRPNLQILPPNGNSTNAIDLGSNGFHDGVNFGFHPSMSGIKNIWDDGNIAFMPATHCGPNPNRSHFYQFQFLGQGRYTTNTNVNDGQGWASRYMNDKYALGPQGIQAFQFNSGMYLFNGWDTLGMNNPDSLYYGMDTNKAKDYINKILSLKSKKTPIEQQIKDIQDFTLSKIDRLEAIDFGANAQNSAVYPNSTLGRQLSQTSKLLRNSAELEIVYLTKGGFDTHSNQASRHPALLKDLSDSLYAFYTDMGTLMNDTTILVMSEFGRTSYENKSETNGVLTPGTDHAHAACYFVIGNNVNGGIYGGWPGLNPDNMDSGRWLHQEVDYRDVLSECLATLEGGDPSSAFLEYSYNGTGVGFTS